LPSFGTQIVLFASVATAADPKADKATKRKTNRKSL